MLDKQFEELKLTGSLPSPSGVGLAILQLTSSEDCTIADIGRTLQADPTLTGRIIKLANSAVHGGSRSVTTVQEAAMRLGVRTLRNVALGFTLVSGSRTGNCKAFDYESYWTDSLSLAVGAQTLAPMLSSIVPSEAFTCGLLSGIGRLALASIHPDRYAELLQEAKDARGDRLASRENEVFGIDHREMAVGMIEDWKLPESFAWGVSWFENDAAPPAAPTKPAGEMVNVLSLARVVSAVITATSQSSPQRCQQILADLARVAKAIGKSDDDVEAWLQGVSQELQAWGKLLNIKTCKMLFLAEIRKRAAEAAPAPTATSVTPRSSALTGTGFRGAGKGLRLLVVDDDPVALKLLTLHLQRDGHQVHSANGGKQGLALALEEMPQVVISDWSMPEMDGLELVKALRRSEDGKRLMVILLTGREEEARIVEAFEGGVDEYLCKPINPKILLARVKAGQRVIELREQVERDRSEREQQLAQLAVLNRKLQAAAFTDALTELPNRRYAMKRLDQELASALEHKDPMCLIMVDVDKFKSVNDGFGHDVGDVVLKEIASLLRNSVRRGDTVARLGGEEFLLICPQCKLPDALERAERLREALAGHVITSGKFSRAVTASFGVAQLDLAHPSLDELFKLADVRVYLAKEGGRNRVVASGGENKIERLAS